MSLPLKVGDTVEDWRPKSVFNPDPANTYAGFAGEVVEVGPTGFRVRWPASEEGDSYEMGYAWAWLGQGINKREAP